MFEISFFICHFEIIGRCFEITTDGSSTDVEWFALDIIKSSKGHILFYNSELHWQVNVICVN